MSTSPPNPPPVATLLDLANVERTLRDDVSTLARSTAAVMADPRTREASQRPVAMGRRMGVVTAVNVGPPLTADVEVNGVTIPGASPQSTYRPQVGDIVWVEIMGSDAHISAPLTTDDNRRWNTLALGGGWTAYAGNTPKYWRDPLAMMTFQGTMGGGSAGVFATLPVGYRPAVEHAFSVPASNGTVWSHALVAVRTTGNLELLGTTSTVEVFLDGIRFRLD